MKRLFKALVLSCFFSLIPLTNSFSIGAGVIFGFTPSLEKSCEISAAGTMRFDSVPLQFYFGFNNGFLDNTYFFGFSGAIDYLFLLHQLKNNWNLYSGAGLGGDFNFSNDFNTFSSLGLRALLGMDWLLLDGYIQIFLQQSIEPCFLWNNGSFYNDGWTVKFPFEAGIRLQF